MVLCLMLVLGSGGRTAHIVDYGKNTFPMRRAQCKHLRVSSLHRTSGSIFSFGNPNKKPDLKTRFFVWLPLVSALRNFQIKTEAISLQHQTNFVPTALLHL
jgi:hypothetical protein